MNYQLIAIGFILLSIAYGVCVLFVLGVTFGAASLVGKHLAVDGEASWTWNVLNISAWLIASTIAGEIVQIHVGIDPFTMTSILAAVLFVVQLRSTFIMKRQQSLAIQLLLCVLCPLAAFVPYFFELI
jgi:hypothetical protein